MLAVDTAAWSSPWRHRHPADLVLLCAALLACVLLLPVWPAAPLVALAVLALGLGPARVPARLLVRAARAPLAFVALAGASVAVTLEPGLPPGLAVTPASLRDAAEVVLRALAGTSVVLLLAATTPLAELLPRLRRLGVPAAVVEVASLVYRMLFLLLDSARTTREAQAGRLGYCDTRTAFRSLGSLGAAVLVRAFERARRLEVGLAGRGYDGELPVVLDDRRPSLPFLAAGALGVALLVVTASLVGTA